MNVDSDAVCTSDTTKCADSPVVHEKIIRARKGSEKVRQVYDGAEYGHQTKPV